MKRFLNDYAVLSLIAGIVIIFDQLTKTIVRAKIPFQMTWVPWTWLEPYARIVHWKNTGAAFGMLQGFSDVFTILAIIVAGAILFYFPQLPKEDKSLRLAMGLQLGGAIGNLIDRLTIGWVTDFISIGYFPVFNIADASISMGVAILVLGVWIKERKERKSEDPHAGEAPKDRPAESGREESLSE